MAEVNEKSRDTDEKNQKNTTKKPAKAQKNTMKISVTNSKGTEVKATGTISDAECKAVIRALSHSDGQIIEVKNHA